MGIRLASVIGFSVLCSLFSILCLFSVLCHNFSNHTAVRYMTAMRLTNCDVCDVDFAVRVTLKRIVNKIQDGHHSSKIVPSSNRFGGISLNSKFWHYSSSNSWDIDIWKLEKNYHRKRDRKERTENRETNYRLPSMLRICAMSGRAGHWSINGK